MNMIEKVDLAIRRASDVRAYGLYDFSGYREEGILSEPYVVRDDRADVVVFRSADHALALHEYERLCGEFIARAAIEAMREPTEAMITYGSGTQQPPEGSEFYATATDLRRDAVQTWQDMIDKALESQ